MHMYTQMNSWLFSESWICSPFDNPWQTGQVKGMYPLKKKKKNQHQKLTSVSCNSLSGKGPLYWFYAPIV